MGDMLKGKVAVITGAGGGIGGAEAIPVSLPLWLERMIKAEGITLDNLKRKPE